jgi:hypothetical protein
MIMMIIIIIMKLIIIIIIELVIWAPTINSSYKTAATLYSLGTLFVSGIYV